MLAGLLGGGLQALGGLIGGIFGGGQRREGRNLLKNLNSPDVPLEYQQAAAEGLPSEQYGQAMRNINRQQSTAIQSAQDRRGGLGMIGGIQQNTNDSLLNLDVKNAIARQKNQLLLGGMKDKKNWADYERKYNYANSLIGAGNQNIANGIDKGLGGLGLIGNTLGNKNNTNDYGAYGNQPTGTNSDGSPHWG